MATSPSLIFVARQCVFTGRHRSERSRWGRFELVPGFWAGFLVLVVMHELGHAWVVGRTAARVTAIDVLPVGGLCHFDGYVTAFQQVCIAWGGVGAQLLVYVATQVAVSLAGPPPTPVMSQLASALTSWNVILIALNLLPIRPLDGAEAWKIVPLLRSFAPTWFAEKRRRRAQAAMRKRLRVVESIYDTPAVAEQQRFEEQNQTKERSAESPVIMSSGNSDAMRSED